MALDFRKKIQRRNQANFFSNSHGSNFDILEWCEEHDKRINIKDIKKLEHNFYQENPQYLMDVSCPWNPSSDVETLKKEQKETKIISIDIEMANHILKEILKTLKNRKQQQEQDNFSLWYCYICGSIEYLLKNCQMPKLRCIYCKFRSQ